MKIRTLGWLIGFSAITSSFLSCTQVKPVCLVGHAGSGFGYAVTYTLKESVPTDCAAKFTHPSGVLLQDLKGDFFGLETYHPQKEGDLVQPDFTTTTVAIQAESLKVALGYRDADATAGHQPYALGKFNTEEPTADNFCATTIDQSAEQVLPAVDPLEVKRRIKSEEPSWVNDALKFKYEWKNLKVYVTAAAPGTQFSGDLVYTQDVGENQCTVTYHAVGLWPGIDCGSYDGYTNNLTKTNPAACAAEADPDAGRVVGSGINPDFPVECRVIRDKAVNRKALDVVCKDKAGKTATLTEDGTCPLVDAASVCVDKAGLAAPPPADGKCPEGSKSQLVAICEDDAGTATEPTEKNQCKEGSKPRLDVVHLRDVVCKTGNVYAVTKDAGECPEDSVPVCEDKDHKEVPAVVDTKDPEMALVCPEDTSPKRDVIYEKDGARVSVPISFDGTPAAALEPGVQPRPQFENLYPALAVCALKGEPPAFDKPAAR